MPRVECLICNEGADHAYVWCGSLQLYGMYVKSSDFDNAIVHWACKTCYNGVVSAGTANSCPYCRGEKLELEKWEYSSYSDWYQFESTVATG